MTKEGGMLMKKINANLEAFKGLLKAEKESRAFDKEVETLVAEKTPEELARMYLIANRRSKNNDTRANNWRRRYVETLQEHRKFVASSQQS